MTCDDKSVEHNHNTTKDLRDIPTTLKAAGESNFKLVIYRTPHGKKIKKIDFSSVSASLSSRCQNPHKRFSSMEQHYLAKVSYLDCYQQGRLQGALQETFKERQPMKNFNL